MSLKECPTCGRDDFESSQGMKMHHAKTHNESIAGFEYDCANCGETIWRKGREHEYHLCSKECQAKYHSEEFSGEKNPRSVGGKYTNKEWLKKKYLVEGETQEQIARKCGVSDVAISKWLDKFDIPTNTIIGKSGENHPRYVEDFDRRPKEWFDLRDELRERTDCCEYCGNESDKTLHVHHVEPVSLGGDVLQNEFVVLCESCHIGDFKRWHPPQLENYIP